MSKPIRAIGFMQGMRGDLIITTVAARAFKEQHPDARLTLGLHRQYEDMLPLFQGHAFYDDYHAWHAYADWPGGEDNLFLAKEQFDIVYHAMPNRSNEPNWWQTEHQCQSACSVYGLTPPANLQCSLTKWFDTPDYSSYIGFQPFGGWQDWPNKKSFSLARAQAAVDLMLAMGHKVLQFGGPDEPALVGATKFVGTYFESMKAMVGCKALLTVDTGRIWCASAYSVPTLGLYANGYYGRQFISSIQPINPNAIYLDEETVDQIPLDVIAARLKELTS